MKNLEIGVAVMAPKVGTILENITAAERAGVDVAWLTCGGLAPDPLPVYAAAARETERIQLGTSVIPTFPRHPLALAQEAIAVDQLAPGRLRLGVGTSTRRVIEGTYGITFRRAPHELRDYITILKSLLNGGSVDYKGELLSARGKLDGPTGIKVMAAALHPQAYRLCGEIADGAISWVTPLPYIRDVASVQLREGAKSAGRPKPALIAHLAVALTEDLEAAREAFRAQLGLYPRFPVYASMFKLAGFPETIEGRFSDRMADAVLIAGDEQRVRARLAELPSYGVDEVIASVLPVGGDGSIARTVELLGAVAREA